MEKTAVQSYNLAIQYLHEEEFEKASPLIEAIIKDYPSYAEARWVLGLLHVLSGFPYKALQQWENIKFTHLQSYRQMVEEKLPLYDELYDKYNQALLLDQAGEFNLAKNIFRYLLTYQKELPLPVDFYHGYLLALIVTGEEESVSQEINHFPLYVKNSSVISELEQMITEYQFFEPTVERKTVSNKGWRKLLFIGSSLAASLLIGGVGLRGFSQQKEVIEVKPLIQQHAINKKIDNDEFEKTVSQEKGENKLLELKAPNNLENVGTLVSSTKAGLSTYKKGLAAFRNQDYRSAAAQMEKSLALQSNEYFSDDALFYLIESKQRLNEKENIRLLYDRFFSQTSKHYVFSPYTDDLLLGEAKILIEKGKTKEALPLVEKILTEYNQEWTSEQAEVLYKKYADVNE